jgi:hypothetical protein
MIAIQQKETSIGAKKDRVHLKNESFQRQILVEVKRVTQTPKLWSQKTSFTIERISKDEDTFSCRVSKTLVLIELQSIR